MQAEHNEEFYNHFKLAATRFRDWATTVMFYAALHYVDSYLATYPGGGVHPQSHAQRDNLMSKDSFLQGLYSDYQELSNRSKDARYGIVQIPPNLVASLRENEFETIRRTIRSRLGLPR